MMNKQEVDNLIANNSIRMTNRQWLESLRDVELARVFNGDMCEHCAYPVNEEKCVSGGFVCCEEGTLAWLRAEHKESDNG